MPRRFQVTPLGVDSGWNGCRDTYVSRVRMAPNINVNIDNWTISLNIRSCDDDQHGNDWHLHDYSDYLNVLWRGVAGETNAEFSPLQSPFVIRWLIGKGRNAANARDRDRRFVELPNPDDLEACRRYAKRFCRDWFAELMIKADKAGIKLNPDLKESWGWQDHTMGSMGLVGLKNIGQSVLEARRLKILDAFPPAKLLL